MPLFLVAVTLEPTKKQRDEEGTGPIVVVPPTPVIAKDEQQAGARAFKHLPAEHEGKEDRMEVHVLPFRSSRVTT